MALKDWSTNDLSNQTISGTSIIWTEGQAPSTLNNSARAVMSDIRAWYEDAEWLNLGDTVTYVSATQFRVPGDLTSDYSVGRKVRAVGSATGTIYGKITGSTFSSPNTTVTVSWDSGSLQNESLQVSLGILQYLQPGESFPAGTKCAFYQAAAPTGWVLDSSTVWNQDRIMIIDHGSPTNYGGSDNPRTMDKVPSHTHTVSGSGNTSTNGNHNHSNGASYAGSTEGGGGDVEMHPANTSYAGSHSHTFSFSGTTSANGGSDNWTPYYANWICATKL